MRRSSLVLLIALTAALGSAQTYPPHPEGSAVYDSAHLLSSANKRDLSALAQRFMNDTGAPIVVATFPSLQSVGAKGIGIERYSTELFNRWRIGSNQANGGILLLVARDDHKVRIELGKDWRHDYDGAAKQINQTVILPAFRKGQFAAGILDGAHALAQMANNQSAPPSQAQAQQTMGFDQDDAVTGGSLLLGPCCCAVPLVLIIFIALRRRRGNTGNYRRGYVNSTSVYDRYDDPSSDAASFAAGVVVGEAMSQPPIVDPTPYDSGSSYDSGNSSDSGGSFDSGGGFDSGSSDGGGDTGSW